MAESALSRRLSEFTGVALFAGALLWLIALVSYTPSDPAWFFNSVGGAPAEFRGPRGRVLRRGVVPALGYAAYAMPIMLGFIGWHYFWCRKIEAGYTKLTGVAMLFGSVAGAARRSRPA